MARGSKAKYTDRQKRQAQHIEKSAEKRGYSTKRAAQIAWSTVNKQDGGGKKSGSGVGHPVSHEPERRGGRRSHKGPNPRYSKK